MSDNTVYNQETSHGLKIPHKFPTDSETQLDVLNSLSSDLYPTGRAWNKPELGVFDNLHEAINVSFARVLEDMKLLIDSTFADNDNFTTDDADLWEYRLGLITNSFTPLTQRKKAIIRKLGHPNNIKARQHIEFIEFQLQLAGFNVWVHENTIPYQTPADVAVVAITPLQHGGISQHGDSFVHGGIIFDVIANNTEPNENYSIGSDDNLWATFFIGGENLGDSANVPASRLKEFKELVIKLKPAHTVAFTLINYI